MVDNQLVRSKHPFFTVIVCSWNRAHLLPRAFDSLLAQTEFDWEVVVIDDASDDNTAEVVQKYEAELPAVLLIHHPIQRGTAAARNSGITHANGKYVTFLDSDDAYTPTHLKLRRRFLQAHPSVQFLHGGVTVVGDPFVIDKDNPKAKILVADCVVGGTFVIRRDVFNTVGLFNEELNYADDADFYARAVAKGIQTGVISDATYVYYRDVEGQLTSSWTGRT